MRYKMTIAYRGTRYHGWQKQTAANTWKGPEKVGESIPSVQETLSKALGSVLGHPVIIVGSSRTDAGVHAKAQLAHFDSDAVHIPAEGMRRATNHQLPDDIVIHTIEPAEEGFDAIASAVRKRYQYFIWNGLDRNVFNTDLCWHRWKPLDVPAMKEAAKFFVGEHDFASYARPGHKRESTVRTVLECSVSAVGPRVVIGVEGTGFLWNMVRIMAGTLVDVGMGHFAVDQVPRSLEARDRRCAGGTAPPHGLFLQWVKHR